MEQAGRERWADHPALLASQVAGAAIPPLAAAGNMCCPDLAEKCGENSSKNSVQNGLL